MTKNRYCAAKNIYSLPANRATVCYITTYFAERVLGWLRLVQQLRVARSAGFELSQVPLAPAQWAERLQERTAIPAQASAGHASPANTAA